MKAEPIDWLLEHQDPSIRFWALQDLESRGLDHPEVQDAQDALMESHVVRTILQTQNPEGYWEKHDDFYLPKYTATTHSLLILAELGAKRTPAIERGLEHIFNFQRDSGHFLTKLPKTAKGKASVVKDGSCLDGNILFYMIHFGYLDDPRVRRLLDFNIGYHSMEDAGWLCRAFPINPDSVFPENCYMGGIKVLKALSFIPVNKRTREINAIIKREVENVLENEIYRYLRNSDGTRKDKAGWKRFGFPLFYQSDVLEVLDTLTRLGVRDERMQESINLVSKARGNDGKWVLKNSYNRKMWVDIEAKNEPSKWITLRATRVLKRYSSG